MSSEKNDKEKAVRQIQQAIRSRERGLLHESIFHSAPKTNWPSIKGIDDLDLLYTIEKAIAWVTENQSIVNEKQIYHCTSLSNLSSIVCANSFYGNKHMRQSGVRFNKNAMNQLDALNGDGNIICFYSGRVDPLAYMENIQIFEHSIPYDFNPIGNASQTDSLNFEIPQESFGHLKKNYCRLTLDFGKTKKDLQNNQLFKIADFGIGWVYSFKIGELLTCIESSNDGMTLTLFVGDKPGEKVHLEKKDLIYYGNCFKINRFCAVQLFNILQKVENPEFRQQFMAYLKTMTESQMRAFITFFSQNLTIYSEFNMNTVLSLDDVKIREILYFEGNKIKVTLDGLGDIDYEKALDLIACGNYMELNQTFGIKISDEETVYEKNGITYLFGEELTRGSIKCRDFNTFPEELLEQSGYVETRSGVSSTPVQPPDDVRPAESINNQQ